LKTADRSKSFSCASRIHHSFSFGAETPARGATTAIPCTSDIVPRLGGWRAILHISGCGGSLKTADRSKSFSCASCIHQLFSFGAGTPARGATTAIPCTSDIVPRLGGGRAILHISVCGGSLKTADRSGRSTAWYSRGQVQTQIDYLPKMNTRFLNKKYQLKLMIRFAHHMSHSSTAATMTNVNNGRCR